MVIVDGLLDVLIMLCDSRFCLNPRNIFVLAGNLICQKDRVP